MDTCTCTCVHIMYVCNVYTCLFDGVTDFDLESCVGTGDEGMERDEGRSKLLDLCVRVVSGVWVVWCMWVQVVKSGERGREGGGESENEERIGKERKTAGHSPRVSLRSEGGNQMESSQFCSSICEMMEGWKWGKKTKGREVKMGKGKSVCLSVSTFLSVTHTHTNAHIHTTHTDSFSPCTARRSEKRASNS